MPYPTICKGTQLGQILSIKGNKNIKYNKVLFDFRMVRLDL